jgi:hypothetical protein
VDPQPGGPDWMQITPKAGSLFHANPQLDGDQDKISGLDYGPNGLRDRSRRVHKGEGVSGFSNAASLAGSSASVVGANAGESPSRCRSGQRGRCLPPRPTTARLAVRVVFALPPWAAAFLGLGCLFCSRLRRSPAELAGGGPQAGGAPSRPPPYGAHAYKLRSPCPLALHRARRGSGTRSSPAPREPCTARACASRSPSTAGLFGRNTPVS